MDFHVDRPPRRDGAGGALLNCVRCTDESGSGASTEILRSAPSDPSDIPGDGQCARCDPFPRNRVVVFNGNWYHRAPRKGGSREFLQVDLNDSEKNIQLVRTFIEYLRMNYPVHESGGLKKKKRRAACDGAAEVRATPRAQAVRAVGGAGVRAAAARGDLPRD